MRRWSYRVYSLIPFCNLKIHPTMKKRVRRLETGFYYMNVYVCAFSALHRWWGSNKKMISGTNLYVKILLIQLLICIKVGPERGILITWYFTSDCLLAARISLVPGWMSIWGWYYGSLLKPFGDRECIQQYYISFFKKIFIY